MATLTSLRAKASNAYKRMADRDLMMLMDITGETRTKDAYLADKKTTTTEYTDVPVTWTKNADGRRVEVAGKAIAYGNYKFSFAVLHQGERINLTAEHKFRVLENGDEPVKVFSIVEIFDNQGITWEVEAKKES